MSIITIAPITPFGQTGQLNIRQLAEDQYATLRAKCVENYGPEKCNAWLPRSMIYAMTRPGEGYTLPWWAWMALGFAAARLIK